MTEITLNGKKRNIKFGLKAWKTLEDKYGTITEAMKLLAKDMENKPFSTVPYLLYLILRDKTEEETEDKILDYLDDYGMDELLPLINAITTEMTSSLPDGDNSKNVSKVKK